MPYFNATEVTRPEADYIRQTTDASLSDTVVISLSSRWYDVRRLTEKELRDFVDDGQVGQQPVLVGPRRPLGREAADELVGAQRRGDF
jgi:hypothetical protein